MSDLFFSRALRSVLSLLFTLPLLFIAHSHAESSALLPALTATPGAGGTQTYSLSVQALLFFGALSFLPALLLMTTAFTRIVIVLSLLRHALGLQTSPPNQVIIGLSLFLTLFVMGPTFDKVYQDAWQPFTQNKISFDEAIQKNLGIMDATAFALCRDQKLPVKVFSIIKNGALKRVVMGEDEGTLVYA